MTTVMASPTRLLCIVKLQLVSVYSEGLAYTVAVHHLGRRQSRIGVEVHRVGVKVPLVVHSPREAAVLITVPRG